MSTTYKTKQGDTFESIARRVYGSEQYALRVSKANPGVAEPLVEGISLTVPPLSEIPSPQPQQAPSNNPSEVSVLIDGARFRFWSDLKLSRSIDAMDTLEFSAPFDVDAPDFKSTFRPFSYKKLEATVGGVPLFTGTLVGVTPMLDDQQKSLSISGYSLPGVLNDCTPPASDFPLEFDNMTLKDIASAVCDPFGITVVFSSDIGSAFERAAIDPGDTVLDFLADLAKQRGLIISSSAVGELIFRKSLDTGEPVAVLKQGQPPLLSVTPSFSPQQYYSHVTGLEAIMVGTEGSQYTVKNPHLTGVLRPLTFKAPDVEGGDINQAVAAKAGRMYGSMVSYAVAVNTWFDPSGELWAPNTFVSLEAPDAMVYSAYAFIVRSVRFSRNGESESAELDLVLPGSFNGQVPEALPWD